MGCDDGQKHIDLMEGNKKTILAWSRTEVFKPTLDEQDDPEALVSSMRSMGPSE
jgi:hypothetical protein